MKSCVRAGMCIFWLSLLVGCGGGGGGGGARVFDGSSAPDADSGSLWIINLVTDSPTLALEVDGDIAALAGYSGSTRRLDFAPGHREVTFSKSVPPDNRLEPLQASAVVDLAVGDEAIVVIYGTMDSLLLDVWQNAALDAGDGSGRTALLNYSRRKDAIDMYLTDTETAPADTLPIASATFSGFDGLTAVDAGQYELEFTNPGGTDVVYNAGLVSLAQDASSYYIVADYFGADPGSFFVLEIAAGAARSPLLVDYPPFELRFINGIPDYPAVDVYFGDTVGEPSLQNVAFTTASAYLPLGSEDTTLIVTPTGVKDAIFYERVFTPSAGFQETLVVSGLSMDSSTAGQLVSDNLRRIADVAELSFIHASSANGPVDIYLLGEGEHVGGNTTPLLRGLDYLLPSDGRTVVPGDYTVTITPAGDNTALLGPIPVSLAGEDIVDFYLFDMEGGGTSGQLELFRL